MNHSARITPSTGLHWLFANLAAFGLIGLLIPQSAAAEAISARGQVQERLGQTIVMVTLHDQELLQTHLDQMTGLMRQRNRFQQGRAGRLQERLGHAVVNTAQAIRTERLELKSQIRITRQELDLLSEDSPAGLQTQMGWAARTAALRAAQGGTAFQAELGKEITRLEKVRQRTINRLENELNALKHQDTEFPRSIPQQYLEARAFALQTAQMEDEVYLASVDRQIYALSTQVMQRQSPLLYAQLAKITRAALTPPAGVGGFMEYGLAAMAGAVAVMVWFGLSNRKGPATPRPI